MPGPKVKQPPLLLRGQLLQAAGQLLAQLRAPLVPEGGVVNPQTIRCQCVKIIICWGSNPQEAV